MMFHFSLTHVPALTVLFIMYLTLASVFSKMALFKRAWQILKVHYATLYVNIRFTFLKVEKLNFDT